VSDEAERVRNEKLGRPFRPHPEERVSASRRMGAATYFGLPEIDNMGCVAALCYLTVRARETA
jgi:hypothetical protein